MQPKITLTRPIRSWLPLDVLPLLVFSADLLIWQVATPRLALAMVALGLVAAAHLLAGRAMGRRAAVMGWGGAMIAALPVIEECQTLSVLFLFAGVVQAAGWFVAGSSARWATAVRAGWRLLGQSVARICLDLFGFGRAATHVRLSRTNLLRDWALPIMLGLLFVVLFLAANPLLDRWTQALADWSPEFALDYPRIGFGLAMAGLIWPFLRLDAMRPRLLAPVKPPITFTLPELLLNPGSALRAMVLFNLIFAMQTGLDLTYLWGGVSLPEGMSYAIYAHRGAYPLVVTALLAGGFALLTQPFLAGRPVLRWLLLLWTAQNILLVGSSILRLDLYVDAYGLTRLRFAALVWMGLVGAGLVLMIWQICWGKPITWLLARAGLLGLATLYYCCFINVAGWVASHNLARPDQTFDRDYLCNLGEGAVPAIAQAKATTGETYCRDSNLFIKAPQDLREWGYRNYRLRNSLAALAASPQDQTDVRMTP